MEEAQKVSNQMPTHNVVSWNPMILGHVKRGEGQRGVELFQQMQHEGGAARPFDLCGGAECMC